MYNAIIFSDCAGVDWFSRGYGAYRMASELRSNGYTALVVDFTCAMSMDMYKEIIDKAVGDDTIFVGFSVTWFPYRHEARPNGRYVVGTRTLKEPDPWDDFSTKHHDWYREGLSYRFSGDGINEYIDYIRAKNPKVKVICGGGKSYEYVHEPAFDNVFIGYSENQLIEWVNSVSKRGARRIFNKIVNHDTKGQVGDFNFNAEVTEYMPIDNIHNEEVMIIEMSRGCIFNCSFCSYPHRNQDTREYIKYKETLRKELMNNWEKWGTYKYLITDDTFNDHTEKLVLINEVIQSLPFKPIFWAYIRMDLIGAHPEQAQLLKDIGLVELYWGLETWCDETSKAIKKGGSLKTKLRGLRHARQVWGDDIYVTAGIVIGLPYDTTESLEAVAEWYKEEGKDLIHLLTFWPLSIRAENSVNQFVFTSDIEDNLAKYGYTVPSDLTWTRSNGNINSKEQADELMFKYNEELGKLWTVKRVIWDYSTFEKLWPADSRTEVIHNFITKHYYPHLIGDLRKQFSKISSSSSVV